MELLSASFGQSSLSQEYSRMAEKAKRSFRAKFWNHQRNCLFDVVKGEGKDASVRPNQILAVSLDFSMLTNEDHVAVVQTVQDKLWARYGLRTLSPDDREYRGRYSGNREERNFAYHNGTVWPWLIGPFVTAFLKTKNFSEDWRLYAFKSFLQPLFEIQLFSGGIGTVSEVFDGNPPHTPGGCISQAWSVAEPLRAYVEDIALRRPTYEKRMLTENREICEADKKEIRTS
jgi:glycogen debranching enzyme